jgi:hypothetical protein
MRARSWELIAADESTVIAKPGLDAIVVEDGESDGGFPNPSCTDEGDGFEVFGETNELLDQFIASKKVPGRGGGNSPRGTLCGRKTVDP